MHRDFHFFGTVLAARAAGCPDEECVDLAEYAELIDETWNTRSPLGTNFVSPDGNKFYWKPKDWIQNKLVQRTVTAVTTTKMMQKGQSTGKLGGPRGEWFHMSWTAFHFVPNLDPTDSGFDNPSSYQNRYRMYPRDAVFDGNFDGLPRRARAAAKAVRLQEQQLICYPGSTLGNAMLADTQKLIRAAGECLPPRGSGQPVNRGKLARFINRVLSVTGLDAQDVIAMNDYGLLPRLFGDPDPSDAAKIVKLITALVGVRLHVYVDFWAHQGFAGVHSPRVNDAIAETFRVKTHDLPWKRAKDSSSWAFKFSAMDKVAPAAHYGHGNAKIYPDLPTYSFQYVRPFDLKRIVRDNPKEYAVAYNNAYGLLSLLNTEVYSKLWNTADFAAASVRPSTINEEFWRHNYISVEHAKDDAHMKNARNNRMRGLIKGLPGFQALSADAWKRLVGPEKGSGYVQDDDTDFGIIKPMYDRAKEGSKNLAFFSIGALYHLKWVKEKLDAHFGGSFTSWVETNTAYDPILWEVGELLATPR